jgi:hypothetical protein
LVGPDAATRPPSPAGVLEAQFLSFQPLLSST